MDPVGGLLQQRLGAHGIVAQSVIGAVGHHRIDRLLPGERPGQRARLCLATDRLGIHLGRRDRTDDAIAVPRRHHIDRPRAGEHQALLDRLVTIAIEHDEIVLLHACLHDAAVRARGADHARIAAMGPKDPRRISFARGNRPGMVEQ